EYEYNLDTGMKIAEIDPLFKRTNYEYDKLNRITKVILPVDDGPQRTYREYLFSDTENNCLFYNENRQKTLFQFDGLGRLTETIKYTTEEPYKIKTTYMYDALGRIERVIDPEGRVTSYEYDGLNRVLKVVFPVEPGQPEQYVVLEYDDWTNTVTITDEEGNQVVERSDWANRLVEAKQYYRFENE